MMIELKWITWRGPSGHFVKWHIITADHTIDTTICGREVESHNAFDPWPQEKPLGEMPGADMCKACAKRMLDYSIKMFAASRIALEPTYEPDSQA